MRSMVEGAWRGIAPPARFARHLPRIAGEEQMGAQPASACSLS
jgi:hypothetical protein